MVTDGTVLHMHNLVIAFFNEVIVFLGLEQPGARQVIHVGCFVEEDEAAKMRHDRYNILLEKRKTFTEYKEFLYPQSTFTCSLAQTPFSGVSTWCSGCWHMGEIRALSQYLYERQHVLLATLHRDIIDLWLNSTKIYSQTHQPII